MVDGIAAIRARIESIKDRFGSDPANDSGFSEVLGGVMPAATSTGGPGASAAPYAPGSGLPPANPFTGPLPVPGSLSGGIKPLDPAGMELVRLPPNAGADPAQAGAAGAPGRRQAGPLDSIQPLIERSAAKYGVDPGLIRAIVRAESGGNPRSVSSRGAQGLMQLMPDTSRALGVKDPFDPGQNIDGGTRYMRHLLDQFKDPLQAAAAYNAGPAAVERYGGIPPFAETQSYVKRVQEYLGPATGPTR